MADINILNELEGQLTAEAAKMTGNGLPKPERLDKPSASAGFDRVQANARTTVRYDVTRLTHQMSDENDAFVCGVIIENPAEESARILADVMTGDRHENDLYDFWLSTIANKHRARIDYEVGVGVVRFFVKPVMPWEVTEFEYNVPYEEYSNAFMALASVFSARRIPDVQKLL